MKIELTSLVMYGRINYKLGFLLSLRLGRFFEFNYDIVNFKLFHNPPFSLPCFKTTPTLSSAPLIAYLKIHFNPLPML